MSEPQPKNPPQGPSTAAAAGTPGQPAAPAARFRQRGFGAGFTQLPNVVLKSRRLSPTAKATYGVLCSYAWRDDHAWPHQTALAAAVNVQDRVLRRALRELRLLGLLTVERRGQGATNVYWLEAIDTFADEEHEWQGAPGATDAPPAADDRTISTVQDRSQTSALDRSQTSALDRSQTSAPLLRKKKIQGKEDTHTTPPPAADHDSSVCLRLRDQGHLSLAVAKKLVAAKGAEACAQQLEWLPLRKARDTAKVLRQAIEESWLPPDGNPKLRLPGERPYVPLPPPPTPVIDDVASAAGKLKARLALEARGVLRPSPERSHRDG